MAIASLFFKGVPTHIAVECPVALLSQLFAKSPVNTCRGVRGARMVGSSWGCDYLSVHSHWDFLMLLPEGPILCLCIWELGYVWLAQAKWMGRDQGFSPQALPDDSSAWRLTPSILS